MARIGYARVSTTDQDLDIQIGRLKNAGCEIIRSETGSGASRSGRTELETIMQFMHTGDELVVLRPGAAPAGGRRPEFDRVTARWRRR